MEIIVKKLTDVDLLRRANEFTTGHESKMGLKRAYFYGHSPIRTQLFWVEITDIPLFVASQLVRQHVGVQFFQRSKRVDRGGEDFTEVCDVLAHDITEIWKQQDADAVAGLQSIIADLPNRFDRYAPTDLACIINAEALINMAHKRLCAKASKETREIVMLLRDKVGECDPDLAEMMVEPCVANGGICHEPKGCGFYRSQLRETLTAKYILNKI